MKPFDIVIVGGGGAGLYAAMEAMKTNPALNIAVLSKVYPNRSHTSAAQGGANAALANKAKDDSVEMHIFDTINKEILDRAVNKSKTDIADRSGS